jgi:hypothetical protein
MKALTAVGLECEPLPAMALKLLNIALCVLAVAIFAAPTAAEQSCEGYATLKLLPDGFVEIASAPIEGRESGGEAGPRATVEFFKLTDGACTCTNEPAVDRELGKSVPQNINWSCRKATPDERKY